MLELNGRERGTPPFPRRRFLRLLSMGCGISKFGPKEVVEVTANCSDNPPRSNKSSTSNCFTGESKPLVQEGSLPEKRYRKADGSSLDREVAAEKMMKLNVNVKRGDVEDNDRWIGTTTRREFEDHIDDQNCRQICRGGSPSFREYCVESESRSRSMGSEDNFEGDHDKWSNERTMSLEKEKELEKKEGRGKGIRKALHRRKSGGGRNS